ncbi:MAG: hypothetical protein JSV38_09500 [Desulfobacterales bacterium]|nr:MAG: hypothetical protein JSV38_09500 [Desulfobacterales bacterium]
MGKKEKSDLFLGIFYSIRKKILLSFYILSITSFGIIIIIGISHIAGVSSKIQIGAALLISFAATVFGAILSVILDLPQIGYYFDEIKNDIALKEIRTPEVFADRLTSLFCNYFNFFFFTVRFCFVKIKNYAYFYSDDAILKITDQSALDEIIITSRKTEDVFYKGPYTFGNKSVHLYIIPIWFGETWLGTVGIFTPFKLLKIFQRYLNEMENLYIDDQLLHVLNLYKANGER